MSAATAVAVAVAVEPLLEVRALHAGYGASDDGAHSSPR